MSLYLVALTVYLDAVAGLETHRWASSGFTTMPDDTPPRLALEDRVINPGNFEYHLFAPRRTRGRSENGYGYVELNNADGELDWLRKAGFGFGIEILRGEDDTEYLADLDRVWTGTCIAAEFTWHTVKLLLRDRQAEVRTKPVNATKYAGTNALPAGLEGVADLVGKPKPRLWGKPPGGNVTPILVNTSRLIYQVNDASSSTMAISAVRDKGVDLPAGSAYASISDMETNAPSAGEHRVYAGAEGLFFRLGSTPEGAVTCDPTEGGTTALRYAGAIIKRVLEGPGGLKAADYSQADLDALDAAAPREQGRYVDMTETDIGVILDELCEGLGAFWRIDRNGVFRFGRLQIPAGEPVKSYTADEIVDNGQAIEVINSADTERGIPAHRIIYRYGRNFTVQSANDVAGAALADLQRYTQEYLAVTATAPNVWNPTTKLGKYPLSQQLVISSLVGAVADATLEATRFRNIYGALFLLIAIVVPASEAVGVDLNDPVLVTVARYELDDGVTFRVLGLIEDHQQQLVTQILWALPDGIYGAG